MSQRSERISDEFQKALSEAIRTLKDPRVHEAMVSVTRCEVTGDLRYAKAYISVFGDEQQKKDVMRGLKSAAGMLLLLFQKALFRLDLGKTAVVNYGHVASRRGGRSIGLYRHVFQLL